jgi:hypothetical protein
VYAGGVHFRPIPGTVVAQPGDTLISAKSAPPLFRQNGGLPLWVCARRVLSDPERIGAPK